MGSMMALEEQADRLLPRHHAVPMNLPLCEEVEIFYKTQKGAEIIILMPPKLG